MGKIAELVTGRDQKVRSARVLVSPHKYLHCPLNLLYPIDCPADKSNGDICNACDKQEDGFVADSKDTREETAASEPG